MCCFKLFVNLTCIWNDRWWADISKPKSNLLQKLKKNRLEFVEVLKIDTSHHFENSKTDFKRKNLIHLKLICDDILQKLTILTHFYRNISFVLVGNCGGWPSTDTINIFKHDWQREVEICLWICPTLCWCSQCTVFYFGSQITGGYNCQRTGMHEQLKFKYVDCIYNYVTQETFFYFTFLD